MAGFFRNLVKLYAVQKSTWCLYNDDDAPAINLVSHVSCHSVNPYQSFYPCIFVFKKELNILKIEAVVRGIYLRRTGNELRTVHEHTHSNFNRKISGLDLY